MIDTSAIEYMSIKRLNTIKQLEITRKRAESKIGSLHHRRTKNTNLVKIHDLNKNLRKFQEDHGVSFTCNTVYTHTATTLKADNNLVVLFQNSVASGQQLIDYKTYRAYTDVENSQMPAVKVRDPPGPFFNLVETSSMFGEFRHMRSKECRQVHETYQNCRPVFSSSQSLICLQRRQSSSC